nr:PREDICTED: lipocalin-15 [Equus przewalskii]
MKSILLGWVLALLWVSVAQAEVLVQPDFDAKKFSGLWYVVSMASDCKVFLGKKDHLLMSTSTVKAITGGNLSVHMEFPRADRCNQVDAEYLKVGSEGHFRVPGRSCPTCLQGRLVLLLHGVTWDCPSSRSLRIAISCPSPPSLPFRPWPGSSGHAGRVGAWA